MPEIQPQDEQPIVKKATIILVTRNRATEVEAALASIAAAVNRPELAVIVMDNGSTDGTNSISEKYGDAITYLRLPKNFGWVKAVNIALRSATTEFVFFLDPAVRLASDTASKMIVALEANSEASAVVANLLTESGETVAIARDLPVPGKLSPILRQPASTDSTVAFPPFQAFLLRKTFLKGMNFLDGRFGDSWADAEICYQIRNAGKKILIVSDASATVGRGLPQLEDADLVEADFMQGGAIYIGKHWGMISSIWYRVSCVLGALVAFKLSVFFNLINGQKIDGTHV